MVNIPARMVLGKVSTLVLRSRTVALGWRRAEAIRSSVLVSSCWRAVKFAFAFRSGVGLGDRDEAAEGLAQHVFRRGLLGGALTGGHRGGPGADDVLEGSALVGRAGTP